MCVSVALLLACGSSGSGDGPNGTAGQGGSAGHGGNGSAGQPTGSAGDGGNGSGSNGGNGAGGSGPQHAGIEMRVASTAVAGGGGQNLLVFAGGGASLRPGIDSLEYYINSVQICESMQPSGSGFSNPAGCLELYRGDQSHLHYELDGDWTSLADEARGLNAGFVDLLDPAALATLNATTELTSEHVRSYNYGIITWSLPVKVKATIPLGDGGFLYTHDGTTTFNTIGVDNFKHYYTAPATSLTTAPAEKAVVLLGNGGNWFKFQNALTIGQADIDERRQWVLDLVFNPDGIVKGYAGSGVTSGNLEEQNDQGNPLRSITVPLLDLAPIPHRSDEQVVRESYLAHLNVGGGAFDLRLELYSVESDPSHTVYGVDAKTLVTSASTSTPSEAAKVSFVVPEGDGALTFQSFTSSPIISGFHRLTEELATTTASVKCASHDDRAGAEGGALIVVDSCPAANIDVTFQLVSRTLLGGELPSVPGDAGAPGDAGTPHDAGANHDAGHGADSGADAGL
jgi:hypothetical protein